MGAKYEKGSYSWKVMIKVVRMLKSAQDFELFGGFKPWHRQGAHSKI
jgi:hypothetical protein